LRIVNIFEFLRCFHYYDRRTTHRCLRR
jgi:hypothetical protein